MHFRDCRVVASIRQLASSRQQSSLNAARLVKTMYYSDGCRFVGKPTGLRQSSNNTYEDRRAPIPRALPH